MDAIAGRGAVQAYAIREGLIEKGGMFAIFVDNGCRPLGTSRVWSGGGKAADCVEQVLQGLELGAAGLVLVCDTPETAASAGDHVAALKRLADLSRSEDERVALAATQELLNRAFGKAAMSVSDEQPATRPLVIKIVRFGDVDGKGGADT